MENTIQIKVVSANGLKGTKNDKFSVFFKIALSDLFTFETPVIENTTKIELDHAYEHNFVVSEAIIDSFINENLTVTLLESLPKEKTLFLGSSSIKIGPSLLPINPFKAYDHSVSNGMKDAILKLEATMNINLDNGGAGTANVPANNIISPSANNGNLLGSSMGLQDPQVPQIKLEITLSRPLVSMEYIDQGRFLTIEPFQLVNLPEEWTLKEPNEKDPTSNIFHYTLTVGFPGYERNLVVKYGKLGMNVGILEVETNRILYDDIPFPENVAATMVEPVKSVTWPSAVAFWIPPQYLPDVKKALSEKTTMSLKFKREVMQKYGQGSDPSGSKYLGTVMVDMKNLGLPRIVGQDVFVDLESVEATEIVPETGLKRGMYETLKTRLGLRFYLTKSLSEKKHLTKINKSLNDYIPKRIIPETQIKHLQSEKVKQSYLIEIEECVRKLAQEYKLSSLSNNEMEATKIFIEHINNKGLFHQMKERLRIRIVDVVRDGYGKKSAFTTDSELHMFLSDLYVFLVDNLQSTVKKVLLEGKPTIREEKNANTQIINELKGFADFAELENDVANARRYHLERVARCAENQTIWFQYAAFCMRSRLQVTGTEAFRELLSRFPKHVPSLIAYGAIRHMQNHTEEARVVLHSAIKIQPGNPLALAVLGLFYFMLGEEVEGSQYLKKANELYNLETETESLLTNVAQFLVSVHAVPLAQEAISQVLLTEENVVQLNVLLAKLEIQNGQNDNAVSILEQMSVVYPTNILVWEHLGIAYSYASDFEKAIYALECALTHPSLSDDVLPSAAQRKWKSFTHYQLALSLLLVHGDDYGSETHHNACLRARDLFLLSIEQAVTSRAWIGVAKASQMLGWLDDAEEALHQSNLVNNRDCEVWLEFCKIYLLQNKIFDASQSMAEAMKLGVTDENELKALGKEFLKNEDFRTATECFRLALENLQVDALETQIPVMDSSPVQSAREKSNQLLATKSSILQEIQELLDQAIEGMSLQFVKNGASSAWAESQAYKDEDWAKMRHGTMGSDANHDLYAARVNGFAV